VRDSHSDFDVGWFVIAMLVSGELMTLVADIHTHWLFIIPAIVVGVWACRSIR